MSLKRKSDGLPTSDSKKPKVNSSITSFFGPPKTVSSSTKVTGTSLEKTSSPPAASPFDKQAWVEKLTPEQKELLTLEIETLHESWLRELKDEIKKPEFLNLKRFLKEEHEKGKKIFPPAEDVYSWYVRQAIFLPTQAFSRISSTYVQLLITNRSRHTPLNTVKVVILGQDPYHNLNQAHGLCFSVRPPTTAPPSLKNIFKAIQNDYPTFTAPPKNGGLLTPWADRGVLLLNTCLTVQAHEANSHANRGWERFTQKVIDIVAEKRRKGVVFMAWGGPAGKRVTGMGKFGQRHTVLKAVHPSPLSANRGWFDCGHFKKANAWLEERYGVEGKVDWDLNVDPVEAGV